MTETPTSKRIDSIQNLLVNTLNQWWSRHGVLSLSATYDASPRFLTLLLYNLLSAKVVFFLQEAVFRNRIFDKPTLLYLHLPRQNVLWEHTSVVICSKFITFAVTKTTHSVAITIPSRLWFAQNSLPLRWQRQHSTILVLKELVVICSKFITFAVTKTTLIWYLAENQRNVECIRNKKRCCLKRRTHG